MVNLIWRERPGSPARHDLLDNRTSEIIAIVLQDHVELKWLWRRYNVPRFTTTSVEGSADSLAAAKNEVYRGMKVCRVEQ